VPPPTVTPLVWSANGSVSPTSVRRGHPIKVSAKVAATKTTKGRVELRLFDPSGTRIWRKVYPDGTFTAGVARSFAPRITIGSTRRTGTWKVSLRIFTPGGKKLLKTKTIATFRVTR
jgi:hypothetical protein